MNLGLGSKLYGKKKINLWFMQTTEKMEEK